MTELMQQIADLTQQHAWCMGCIPALILGFVLLVLLGTACAMSESICGINYFGMLTVQRSYRPLGVVLFALSVGCLIALGFVTAKGFALEAQIELLKYQLDNVTPILPMN